MQAMKLMAILVSLVVVAMTALAAAAHPQGTTALAGCSPGSGYDPACDVNRDNKIDAVDIGLTAGHWGRTGVWSADYWSINGNAGLIPGLHVLGTTDPVSLTMVVDSVPALRLELAGPTHNVVGGSPDNQVTAGAGGGAIGGGGAPGNPNRVTDRFGTIGGGSANLAGNDDGMPDNATHATVGGGFANQARAEVSTVGGGESNAASGDGATVAGGLFNLASGGTAAIGGGVSNRAEAGFATIGGGEHITVTHHAGAVTGGSRNLAAGDFAFVGGGLANRAEAAKATIGGGEHITVTHYAATVGGGANNLAAGEFAFIGGGRANVVEGNVSVVAGGVDNTAGGTGGGNYAFVGGGQGNSATHRWAVVSGGWGNSASARFATIGGGGQAVEGDPTTANEVTDEYGTVGGGGGNLAGNDNLNVSDAIYATVAGGGYNSASRGSTVGGGYSNTAGEGNATISGGLSNTIEDPSVYTDSNATIGGGLANTVTDLGYAGTIAGGQHNQVDAPVATVPGGQYAAAANFGQMAYASSQFAAHGDAQASLYVLHGTTSNATPTNLYLDPAATEVITVDEDRAMAVDILVIGRSSDGLASGFRMEGVLKGQSGTVYLVGVTTSLLASELGVTTGDVIPKVIGDGFTIEVTGPSSKTVRWVATVRAAEVAW